MMKSASATEAFERIILAATRSKMKSWVQAALRSRSFEDHGLPFPLKSCTVDNFRTCQFLQFSRYKPHS